MQATRLTHVRIGCAGWAIPKQHAGFFPVAGSHLERYAGCFRGVEINTSFYRPHRPATYARWANAVPDDFQFAVKVPREITHERRLADTALVLECFLSQVSELGKKLGPLLVQLPPSLTYVAAVAQTFFETLRARFAGHVVCEARHTSWFTSEARQLLAGSRIGGVGADPAVVPEAAEPVPSGGLVYYRLHGAPRRYYSAYPAEFLRSLADRMRRANAASVWCIFDNTALGASMENALQLGDLLRRA